MDIVLLGSYKRQTIKPEVYVQESVQATVYQLYSLW